GNTEDDVGLPAEDWGRKREAGDRERWWLSTAVDACVEVSVEIDIDIADWHLLCEGHVPAGGDLRILEDISESEPGHLRSCRQAPDKAGHRETHAPLVGEDLLRWDKCRSESQQRRT